MSFIHHTYYRWWQLNYCCIHLSLVLGVSMNPSWLIFFQMGWWKTHQLAIHWKAPSKAGNGEGWHSPNGFPPHWGSRHRCKTRRGFQELGADMFFFCFFSQENGQWKWRLNFLRGDMWSFPGGYISCSKGTQPWMVARRSFPLGSPIFRGELLVSGRVPENDFSD